MAPVRSMLVKLQPLWRNIVKRGGRALHVFRRVMRQQFMPALGRGSVRLKGELVKIHRQQNWIQRCSSTFAGNAAGLGMAMLSTRLVESMVETRELSNLWGLFADRPVVSETTFEVLSFIVEFVLGLIVFTITEYYISEYQQRRNGSSNTVSDELAAEEGKAPGTE